MRTDGKSIDRGRRTEAKAEAYRQKRLSRALTSSEVKSCLALSARFPIPNARNMGKSVDHICMDIRWTTTHAWNARTQRTRQDVVGDLRVCPELLQFLIFNPQTQNIQHGLVVAWIPLSQALEQPQLRIGLPHVHHLWPAAAGRCSFPHARRL